MTRFVCRQGTSCNKGTLACTIGAVLLLLISSQKMLREYYSIEQEPLYILNKNSGDDDGVNGGTSPDSEAFSFPSVEERVLYYMGSWHSSLAHDQPSFDPRTLDRQTSLSSLCPAFLPWANKSHEKAVAPRLHGSLYLLVGHSTSAYHCFQWDGSHNRGNPYCPGMLSFATGGSGCNDKHSYHPLTSRGEDDIAPEASHDRLVLVGIGDGPVGANVSLPIIVKARFSGKNYRGAALMAKAQMAPFHQILWPYKSNRFFGPIFQNEKVLRSGVAWEDKMESLVWRGSRSNNRGYSLRATRLDVVRRWYNRYPNRTDIDVAFSKKCGRNGNNDCSDEGSTYLLRPALDIAEHVKYKYLLSLEGNDVASGLKWMLFSNSVVFMPRPIFVTWFMEDKLIPFIHYIPVKDDVSDLEEMVDWARNHDEECREISRRSTEYVERFVLTKIANNENTAVMAAMRTMYHDQGFGDQYRDFCLKAAMENVM